MTESMSLPLRPFTVVYTYSKRQPCAVKLECHHHVARVQAPSSEIAMELCRNDMLPGYAFACLAMFEGTPKIVTVPLSTGIKEFTHGEPA